MFKLVSYVKEVGVLWIRAGGSCVRVGGLSKILKRGWNRKNGREAKILKKKRQAGSRYERLKKGGGFWNPLTKL